MCFSIKIFCRILKLMLCRILKLMLFTGGLPVKLKLSVARQLRGNNGRMELPRNSIEAGWAVAGCHIYMPGRRSWLRAKAVCLGAGTLCAADAPYSIHGRVLRDTEA